MCSIWKAMLVEEMFSSVRSCFSKSCDYIYVSLFSFLFHFSLFSFSLFSLRFLFSLFSVRFLFSLFSLLFNFSLFSFSLFSCFTKTTAGHRALDGGQRGGLEWHICFPDWTSSHQDDTQHLLFIIYLLFITHLLFLF